MKRLISFGNGFQFVGDTSQEPAPTVGDLPRLPQKVRNIRRVYPSIVAPMLTKHNGYRPERLIDLCTDQCRFCVADGIMCGLKVVSGKSWCAAHDAIVHGRFLEAAE